MLNKFELGKKVYVVCNTSETWKEVLVEEVGNDYVIAGKLRFVEKPSGDVIPRLILDMDNGLIDSGTSLLLDYEAVSGFKARYDLYKSVMEGLKDYSTLTGEQVFRIAAILGVSTSPCWREV